MSAASEGRIEGLCNRVRALERMMAHVLESSKPFEDLSASTALQAPMRPISSDDEDEANQFAVRSTAPDDLSLSSQLAAMGAYLSRPASPKANDSKQHTKGKLLVKFPDPMSLQRLLDVYFRDMDNYFPFLDRRETEMRIDRVARRLGYSSYNRILVVPTEDLSDIALACIMLALAESLDTGKTSCEAAGKPGWDRYIQSCHAIQRSCRHVATNMNIVGAQCLVAAYLMHCEFLGAASQAISVAWQLATSIRLNNKRARPHEYQQATLQRRKLWWTIYYLDRQISRRSGTAYHIRDIEFDVDDFAADIDLAASGMQSQMDKHSNITRSYLQALIGLARLWGQVWDTFFAVGATTKGDWMEVEIMDARILNTRRQLPRTLTWAAEELVNYTLTGESEPHVRRRLQLYTVSPPHCLPT